MERRAAIGALLALGLVGSGRARADRTARVGLVWNSLPQVEVERDLAQYDGPRALVEGLRRRGWVQGRNLELVSMSAEGRYERFPSIIDALAAIPVDVIVVFGSDAAQVAQERAKHIPLVDTVAFNQAPGVSGRATGTVVQNPVDKRLELLKQVAPRSVRVGMFVHAPRGGDGPELSASLRQRIALLGMEPLALPFTVMEDFDRACEKARRWSANAVYISGFGKLYWDRMVQDHVLSAVAANRWPAVYEQPELVARGALMGYGPDVRATHERAAYFIDRLLRGAKLAELPVEQPRGFVLALNRGTAHHLGLTLPPAVLIQADEVVG